MPGPGHLADGPDRRFGAGAATREEDADTDRARPQASRSPGKVREGVTDQ